MWHIGTCKARNTQLIMIEWWFSINSILSRSLGNTKNGVKSHIIWSSDEIAHVHWTSSAHILSDLSLDPFIRKRKTIFTLYCSKSDQMLFMTISRWKKCALSLSRIHMVSVNGKNNTRNLSRIIIYLRFEEEVMKKEDDKRKYICARGWNIWPIEPFFICLHFLYSFCTLVCANFQVFIIFSHEWKINLP